MNTAPDPLKDCLKELRLPWIRENCDHEIAEAARKNRSHHELLARLAAGETEARRTRAVIRRLKAAKLPLNRSMDTFDWHWPESINRDQIQHLFNLSFMRETSNVVLVGTVGLGKTHIASALGKTACERGHSVLCIPAVEIINDLAAAQQRKVDFRKAMRRYTKPDLLIIDELGYLPVDRVGAELLFQVLGSRYETASTIITTNRIYRDWTKTFADDAALTSAVLDRVMHHCETIIITGKSYRMKDRIQTE